MLNNTVGENKALYTSTKKHMTKQSARQSNKIMKEIAIIADQCYFYMMQYIHEQ